METARHHSKYLRGEYRWLKQEAEKRGNEIDENGEVVQLPTVLQNPLNVLEKKRMLLHLSLTFYTRMGDPIYKFIEGIQVDVVPKGGRDGERCPIAHRLHARVLELEAKLETYVQGITQVPGVLAFLDVLKQLELHASRISLLQWVGKKVLAAVEKYKRKQLAFFDQVRVFDPRQRDSMPRDISHYTLLFPDDTVRREVRQSGEWALHWKQEVPVQEGFRLLKWWGNAAEFKGFCGVWHSTWRMLLPSR